jgi:hypothetical protein
VHQDRSVAVHRVASRRDVRRFINHPYDRYAGDPHWIPQLRLTERHRLSPRHNPFFAHARVDLFLATRDGAVVGRVAAIDDRLHNECASSTSRYAPCARQTSTTSRSGATSPRTE